jgi:hypothetical protein
MRLKARCERGRLPTRYIPAADAASKVRSTRLGGLLAPDKPAALAVSGRDDRSW